MIEILCPLYIIYVYYMLSAHSFMYVLKPILQMLLNEYDLLNNKTFKAYALFSSFKIILQFFKSRVELQVIVAKQNKTLFTLIEFQSRV